MAAFVISYQYGKKLQRQAHEEVAQPVGYGSFGQTFVRNRVVAQEAPAAPRREIMTVGNLLRDVLHAQDSTQKRDAFIGNLERFIESGKVHTIRGRHLSYIVLTELHHLDKRMGEGSPDQLKSQIQRVQEILVGDKSVESIDAFRSQLEVNQKHHYDSPVRYGRPCFSCTADRAAYP